MMEQVILWGMFAGILHFMLIGVLYNIPAVARQYELAAQASSAVKKWPSKTQYIVTQFLGTQIEVFILASAFFWLRPSLPLEGLSGALALGLLLALLRVYPRFWNMWIQSNYPNRLLAIELVNGTIGTLAVISVLEVFAK
ncbi:MAG: hypothetical protein AB7G93_22145 [Bdellovibrionales bacterium]